ncbi:MAG: hypothetical protein NTX96_01590 [Candidatus Zambryskibacteria bacterium]|nr:hypothetical protein [Candidatus Zambryskibacteria bacterium]
MNEETLKNMPEYMKGLPESVQDLVFDGVWEERTEEIAKKYSLGEPQTDSLINNVLFILIGLKDPDDFLETLILELGTSRLLAEQIIEDLEVRVFEYAVKSIQNKEKKTGGLPVQVDSQKNENKSSDTKMPLISEIPEIKPDNLPMIEKGEVAHDVLRQPVSPNQELIQKPISVPRYTGVPIEGEGKSSIETKPIENLPPVPKPIPQPLIPSEPTKPPEPVPPPVKNYAVDPYREPLE